jgi:hypothetical protein
MGNDFYSPDPRFTGHFLGVVCSIRSNKGSITSAVATTSAMCICSKQSINSVGESSDPGEIDHEGEPNQDSGPDSIPSRAFCDLVVLAIIFRHRSNYRR